MSFRIRFYVKDAEAGNMLHHFSLFFQKIVRFSVKMLILAANYFHKILLLMKKHSFLMRLLLFFLLLATGSVSRLSAAESPGDSLFNAAYTDVQVLILSLIHI